VEERIRVLLAPIASELGVDVLKVSWGGGGHRQLLRVVVDRAGGVSCEILERVSRALSLQLDAEGLIHGRYDLEVSSPGLDWPLADAADFRRHVGEILRVSFEDGGTLVGVNLGPCEGGVRIRDEQGRERRIRMQEVSRIVRVVDWKQKGGGRHRGKRH